MNMKDIVQKIISYQNESLFKAVSQDPSLVRMSDKDSRTSLMYALAYKRDELSIHFINVNPESIYDEDILGNPVPFFVISRDVFHYSWYGLTTSYQPQDYQESDKVSLQLLKLILSIDPELAFKENKIRDTCLIYAACYGGINLIRFIANNYPSQVDTTNVYGNNALHMAAAYDRLDVVKWFIQDCSSPH